jgi:hypothetical protein
MLSFVTSQAIAPSQARQSSTTPSDAGAKHVPTTSKPLVRRFLDALFEARMRRAEIEVEHHRRFYEGHTK